MLAAQESSGCRRRAVLLAALPMLKNAPPVTGAAPVFTANLLRIVMIVLIMLITYELFVAKRHREGDNGTFVAIPQEGNHRIGSTAVPQGRSGSKDAVRFLENPSKILWSTATCTVIPRET